MTTNKKRNRIKISARLNAIVFASLLEKYQEKKRIRVVSEPERSSIYDYSCCIVSGIMNSPTVEIVLKRKS